MLIVTMCVCLNQNLDPKKHLDQICGLSIHSSARAFFVHPSWGGTRKLPGASDNQGHARPGIPISKWFFISHVELVNSPHRWLIIHVFCPSKWLITHVASGL